MNQKFKTGLTHLAPILTSLLFGITCSYIILISGIEIQEITPFPEEGFGSLQNAAYFVILIAIGASTLYLLLKRKNRRLVTMITGFALTSAVFMLSFVYLWAAFSGFTTIPNAEVLVLLLALLITVLADLAIFRARSAFRNVIVLCLGGALGNFLGISIPTSSTILILSFLAVYDVFAVYHGPVGKIARSGLEQLRGLSFSFKDIQMGLGDLTFYSMLISHVLIVSGPLFCFASVAGVLIGVFLAFKILERKGMFPGLPFPIALGLIPLIVWLL